MNKYPASTMILKSLSSSTVETFGPWRCLTWSDRGWLHFRQGSDGEAEGVSESDLGGLGVGRSARFLEFFQPLHSHVGSPPLHAEFFAKFCNFLSNGQFFMAAFRSWILCKLLWRCCGATSYHLFYWWNWVETTFLMIFLKFFREINPLAFPGN